MNTKNCRFLIGAGQAKANGKAERRKEAEEGEKERGVRIREKNVRATAHRREEGVRRQLIHQLIYIFGGRRRRKAEGNASFFSNREFDRKKKGNGKEL